MFEVPCKFPGGQYELINHQRNPIEECVNIFICKKQAIFQPDGLWVCHVIRNNIEYCIAKHKLKWEQKKI